MNENSYSQSDALYEDVSFDGDDEREEYVREQSHQQANHKHLQEAVFQHSATSSHTSNLQDFLSVSEANQAAQQHPNYSQSQQRYQQLLQQHFSSIEGSDTDARQEEELVGSQNEREAEVVACDFCREVPDNFLSLACGHDLCLQCMLRAYEQCARAATAATALQIPCTVCGLQTTLDRQSIEALDQCLHAPERSTQSSKDCSSGGGGDLVSIANVPKKETAVTKTNYCSLHPSEEANLYCFSCQGQWICVQCLTATQKHVRHEVRDQGRSVALLEQKLEQLMDEVSAKQLQCNKNSQAALQSQRTLGARRQLHERQATELFAELHTALEQRKAAALQAINDAYAQHTTRLRTHLEHCEQDKQVVDTLHAQLKTLNEDKFGTFNGANELTLALNYFAQCKHVVTQISAPTAEDLLLLSPLAQAETLLSELVSLKGNLLVSLLGSKRTTAAAAPAKNSPLCNKKLLQDEMPKADNSLLQTDSPSRSAVKLREGDSAGQGLAKFKRTTLQNVIAATFQNCLFDEKENLLLPQASHQNSGPLSFTKRSGNSLNQSNARCATPVLPSCTRQTIACSAVPAATPFSTRERSSSAARRVQPTSQKLIRQIVDFNISVAPPSSVAAPPLGNEQQNEISFKQLARRRHPDAVSPMLTLQLQKMEYEQSKRNFGLGP